ncbi:MAG: restriction endonuclease subunit S [Clostridia bacterium]|nr:restriction endonuclease subunit S [Clostridia bacterium]
MDRFGNKVTCNPKIKINKNEPIRLLPMEDIDPIYKYAEGSEESVFDGQGGVKFSSGDILMARITPCLENGKIAIANTGKLKGVGSTEYFVFRGIKGVSDTNYIYYLLNTEYMRQMAVNSMTGASGRQRADLGFIQRIKWDFPDYEEQKRIASLISPFDDLVSINTKKIQTLQEVLNELFREWFTRFRFPGYRTSAFVEGIPENWHTIRIGDICSFVSRGITPDYVDEGVIVLNQKCVRNGKVSFEPSRMTDSSKKYKKEKILQFGDTLINSTGTGTLGRTAIYYYSKKTVTVDGHVSIVRADNPLYSFFVGLYMRNIETYIENLGKGSTNQIELSSNDIRRIKVTIPKEDNLLIAFNDIADNIFNQIRVLEEKNSNLIIQRNAAATRLILPKG